MLLEPQSNITNRDSNVSDAAQLWDKLRGVLLPIPTPFNAAGEVDAEALRSNLRAWNRFEMSGYVVLGSTGERVNLDEAEYLQVIEAARAEVSQETGGRVFIVGAGQQSTLATIREIKRVAAAVSLDAALVITPHFYRSAITQSALVDHYRQVAEHSPVPLILYSMPALTGVTIEPDTAARLSEHENIIGIKDSSADIAGLQQTIKRVSVDFAVFTGNGTVFNEGLAAGARGGILAVACAAPKLCLEIYQARRSGEMELAAELQSALSPLAAAVTTRFGVGGLKAALEFRGLFGGHPRTPLAPADETAREEIRQCLERADQALSKLSASEVGVAR